MFPPGWFLALDVLTEIVTAIVALIVAVYAFKGFRWIGERSLFYIYVAFSLLSAAFFASALTFAYAWLARLTFAKAAAPFVVLDLGLWTYYGLSVLAFAILVYAYVRQIRELSVVAAVAGGSLFFAAPVFESLMVILLFVILIAQLTHYNVKKSRNSMIVTSSFLMLLLSHIFILFGNIESLSYVAGKMLQLVAFLTLLSVLGRLRGGP